MGKAWKLLYKPMCTNRYRCLNPVHQMKCLQRSWWHKHRMTRKKPKFWVARATAVQWEQLHTKLQNGLTVPYFQLHSDSTRCRATRVFDSFPPFHILKNMSHYSPHWVMAWETWTVLFQEKAKTSPLGMQEVSSARSLRCRTELAAILFTTKHWTKGYTFA